MTAGLRLAARRTILRSLGSILRAALGPRRANASTVTVWASASRTALPWITRPAPPLGLGAASAVAGTSLHAGTGAMRTTVHAHGWAKPAGTTTTHGLRPTSSRTWATFHPGTGTVGTTMHTHPRAKPTGTASTHGLRTASTGARTTSHAGTGTAAKTCAHFLVRFLEFVLCDAAIAVGVHACKDLVGIGHPSRWRTRPATLRTSAGRLRLDDRAQREKHGKRAYAHPNWP